MSSAAVGLTCFQPLTARRYCKNSFGRVLSNTYPDLSSSVHM